jgi:hypothetical protein
MAGKPLIVAILAGMVVTMIGVVFLQKAPDGFVVSGLMKVGDEDQNALEAQLRKEATAEGNTAIDPQSLTVVKTSQQGSGGGVDVAVQAQGANSRSAMDYLNELMVRYARRQGKVEESVTNKLEISDAERKLTAALKEKEAAMERIEATEKEVKHLLVREQIEAQKVAKTAPEPEPKRNAPKLEAPVEVAEAPVLVEKAPKARTSSPIVDVEPVLPQFEPSQPVASEPSVMKERAPAARAMEPASDPILGLSAEERADMAEALRILKSDRLKLIHGGRRPSHPAVQELDRQIQEINSKLQPKAKAAYRPTAQKVKFEYVTTKSKEPTGPEIKVRRVKLEKELAVLKRRLEKATKIEVEQKARLVELVKTHTALDLAFKPVILAPAKVITTIQPPFPMGRLIGTLCGAVIAGSLGFILAKLSERPRTLASISEAEMVLRMPVQSIERPVVRRKVA